MIPADKIESIKASADIVEVIADFVKLKKQGKEYVGLSPFSNERTPSFSVSPAKGIYKCFSSGKGGDAINFVMEHLSLKYYDAISYLAKKYKIDIESDVVYQIPERKPTIQLLPSFIPVDHVKPTLGRPDGNNLFKFLCTRFSPDIVLKRFREYFVGTYGDWCIFWQVDAAGRVRSGKYIKYLDNGHRDKSQDPSWHHNRTKEYKPVYPDFNMVQCLFGEHLIAQYPRRPIAIVESEKTALIASLFIDKYTWVSCGMKGGLNATKLAAVANRSVTLFPDLNAYKEWKEKAKEFNFNISDHIDRFATDEDRIKGLDLADFLLR